MAAYTKDYTFDHLTRIGDDSCGLSQRNVQNVSQANYSLTNFFSQDCGMKRPIEFATSQPNINFSGSHQVGMGGCNIDTNSDLLIGTINTHPKCRISLLERPFKTVPYLGRGSVDPTLELQLLEGEPIGEKKSTSTVMSQSFMGYTLHPTNNEMEERVTDPKLNVEESAMKGWVRGGADTRVPADCDMKRPGGTNV